MLKCSINEKMGGKYTWTSKSLNTIIATAWNNLFSLLVNDDTLPKCHVSAGKNIETDSKENKKRT